MTLGLVIVIVASEYYSSVVEEDMSYILLELTRMNLVRGTTSTGTMPMLSLDELRSYVRAFSSTKTDFLVVITMVMGRAVLGWGMSGLGCRQTSCLSFASHAATFTLARTLTAFRRISMQLKSGCAVVRIPGTLLNLFGSQDTWMGTSRATSRTLPSKPGACRLPQPSFWARVGR